MKKFLEVVTVVAIIAIVGFASFGYGRISRDSEVNELQTEVEHAYECGFDDAANLLLGITKRVDLYDELNERAIKLDDSKELIYELMDGTESEYFVEFVNKNY